jgi:hydroxypyruvate reductase
MLAAGDAAREMGYTVLLLTSRITGEARAVAGFLAGIAADISQAGIPVRKPACIISGGEPVVILRGTGKGGRNQEMALAFLAEIRRRPELYRGVSFLAASTDGSDGPTDAAGAFATLELLDRARRSGLRPEPFLDDNDSYHFFDAVNGLFRTGPTRTNVCDLHILMVDDPDP